ncbi:NAD(P)H-dependent oxidoreductase [Streptococcus sp. HF-1907]|uniref:NADPH-dependent FMN reductase n=1 Tax=Streptococcus sp. HF-1907 TaxID=2785793 RepID=UPI00189ECAF9|nr:NADPH-dependent FMN reductase [Streptococcus sp. HF-1907]MBF7093741.1 NAD(P)H-dependent oxidoreductase [Streptococcus sp. HF-1907]
MKLIGIVGTNSAKSTNRQLLQYIQKHYAETVDIELVEIKDLPVFNKPADKTVPDSVLDIATKIEAADGVIIGTPEYDHSIPAALMNALAWLSYGIFPLLNKPVMITGASYGTLGSSRAQLQLRQILNAPELKATVLPGEFLLSHSLQAFDQEGNLRDLDTVKKLDAIFDDFRIFVKIAGKLQNAQDLLHKEAENFDWESL